MANEPALAPGEQVLWRGRPSGRPRVGRIGLAYLFLVAFLFAFGPWLARGKAARVFRPTVSLFVRDEGGVLRFSPHLNPVESHAWIGWTVLLGVTLGLELLRTTAWRARQYLITDRRVVAIDWQGRVLAQVPRLDVGRVSVENRDLVVEGLGRVVRLEGLDDPDAARAALGGST